MASLSLPRVLQQRKTMLEVERENFEKFQGISISKAINQVENPVKEKHVRSAIIGTFQEKGGNTFWSCVLRLPLEDNRIIAWKFCHVLHKVLREGHPQVIPHSQRYKRKIEDIGKLWGHLKEGYGKLIYHYCRLLKMKLDFHSKNPRFPGNLQVTKEELESIGENDINNYFQMSVEMFDYMDEILALQAAIFGSLDMSRANSMTCSGQCRLAPLIPCIQDSSQLYDYCVKFLFKLHASLPSDTLKGHRERFLKQFRDLRQFYISASNLQYFKNLIHIPFLPESPPNFLVQSDLGTYVTPVVILPRQPPESSMSTDVMDSGGGAEALVNLDATSDSSSTTGELVDLGGARNGSISPDIIAQRDSLIEQLQAEIARLRVENQMIIAEYKRKVEELKLRIVQLEDAISAKDNELLQERQVKEDLLLQTEAVEKFQETEKKAKGLEEKFQKLKDVYTKLREEHIQLLRQKAEVDKQLTVTKASCEEAERLRISADAKLKEIENDRLNIQQSLQQSASQADDLKELVAAKESVEKEKEAISNKLDWVLEEKATVEGELVDLLAQKEALDVRLEQEQKELKRMQELSENEMITRIREFIESCITEAESILRRALHEMDNPAFSAVTCTPDYFGRLESPVTRSLECTTDSYSACYKDKSTPSSKSVREFLRCTTQFSNLMADFIIRGQATSNSSANIEQGERVAGASKTAANQCLTLLETMKEGCRNSSRNEDVDMDAIEKEAEAVRLRIKEAVELAHLIGANNSVEIHEDQVEKELADIDRAIDEAAARIEEMLRKSREADSGIKLEVNGKILDSCTALMKAIHVLVQKSRLLQTEIVAQGKGTASAKEFYKRNHQWTEGLISAAKAVAIGAKFFVNAADKAVQGEGKFEQVVVASQEIAASTAQLVIASKVKASRDSANLHALSDASKAVARATGAVVATAKDCSQLVAEQEDFDVSRLSLHQAKTLAMESQVRVLELESLLQKEREKVSTLRRHHYQLGGELEGWDEKDIHNV
ncbi:huntingtin-interacting protein 1 isoform X2 [Ischnura elegans]|uniref:huntingtin-interacting protein 1 isoform X2 n=1 Tax=Ischnura elegans TaxID=197161 RepID=UPI001ED86EF6|nr:huntingtin-interacting protein 1 isoform X2 [Ischnura elegans]